MGAAWRQAADGPVQPDASLSVTHVWCLSREAISPRSRVRPRFRPGGYRLLTIVGAAMLWGGALSGRAGDAVPAQPAGVVSVRPDGSVVSTLHPLIARLASDRSTGEVRFDFGMPALTPVERRFEDGARSIAQTVWEQAGIRYRQMVVLTRLDRGELFPGGGIPPDAVLLVQLVGECMATEYTEASACFALEVDGKPANLELLDGWLRLRTLEGGRMIGAIDIQGSGIAESEGTRLRFRASMPPGTSGAMTVKLPVFSPEGTNAWERLQDLDFSEECRRVKRWWSGPSRAATNPPVRLAAP